MSAFLRTDGLGAGYGSVRVLEDVTIEVGNAQTVAVVGPNGAGKTTLARTLSGLTRAQRGSITVDGQDVTRWSPEARARFGIVQVPEGRRLFPRYTVAENLDFAFFARRGRVPEGRRRRLLDKACDLFPVLRTRSGQKVGTLSGGEQQMLAVARAFLLEPRLLILDEPSTGLAPIITAQMFATIRGMVDSAGCACLIIEQQAMTALEMATHAYVLDRGRVAFAGPAASVLEDERLKHGYVGGPMNARA